MLIVACDGLWDVYTSEDAVRLARDIFAEGETDESLVAEELLDMALLRGSKDNISAVVVRFDGAVIGPASLGGVLRRRKLRDENARREEKV
jgi:serine/threonine protein phosphatase PrpC